MAGFAQVSEVAGEGEVGAEGGEGGDHFGGAAVGVEEKTVGEFLVLKDFEEPAPGF